MLPPLKGLLTRYVSKAFSKCKLPNKINKQANTHIYTWMRWHNEWICGTLTLPTWHNSLKHCFASYVYSTSKLVMSSTNGRHTSNNHSSMWDVWSTGKKEKKKTCSGIHASILFYSTTFLMKCTKRHNHSPLHCTSFCLVFWTFITVKCDT